MYPTIVVILVETQRSMTDIYEIGIPNTSRLAGRLESDHEARSTTLGHPSLAVGPINGVMDNEAESRLSRTLQSQDMQERDFEKVIAGINLKEGGVSTSG